MKHVLPLALASLVWLVINPGFAQSVQLSYPLDRSVIQRNSSDQATVTIAGQVTGGSSNIYTYQLYYRIATLNASGSATSTTSWVSVSMQSTGQFSLAPTYSKGWYRLDMGVYDSISGLIVVASSVKFGVGDVYVIAGQSNAQGVNRSSDGQWDLPATSGFPEWVVGVDLAWGCRSDYPDMPTFTTVAGQTRIGPTGGNSWCYAVLGKQISDANGGMPVAFFNAAYGGSSVLNWSQSSVGTASNQPYTSFQTCFFPSSPGSPTDASGKTAADYNGFPYRTLKNTLNLYTSLSGVRALIWHQGEADADPNAANRTTATQDYKDRLQQVINQTRADFGHNDLSWMIARATFTNGGNITTSIRDAQYQKGNEYDKNEGPDTDYTAAMVATSAYRSDGTHFSESNSNGLTFLANKWSDKINGSGPAPAGFNRIVANPVPTISVSKSGSNRILSVTPVSGAQEYRWGYDINSPSQQGATLSSITVSGSSGTLRCFIKDASGNWRISPKVYLGCPSCREGVDEPADEDPWGITLMAYPNPFVKNITVEFNVPQAGSDVRLEIIDLDGTVIQTVTDGRHDKGHWKYPLSNLPLRANKMYFCRLKVGDLFVTKKILAIE